MIEIVAYFYPDTVEPSVFITSVTTLEEYFTELRELCELHKSTLQRTRVLIFHKGKVIIRFNGALRTKYAIEDDYKEFEPIVLDIYHKYFKDAKEKNKIKITTVEELRNADVIINGYTMPQDYDYGPEYSTKCKVCEAFEILKEVVSTCPEMFYNLQFHVWTRDEEYLFCIRRDLETIHLGSHNEFNLTKDMVREALGIK